MAITRCPADRHATSLCYRKFSVIWDNSGTDISASPLPPGSEFLKKGFSGKYILVFTCPIGQADFPNTEHIS